MVKWLASNHSCNATSKQTSRVGLEGKGDAGKVLPAARLRA